jgi:hypothetical protein
MSHDSALRVHLAQLLHWRDAHVDFDAVVNGIEPKFRGITPEGWTYSAWQLLEHIRITQEDILQFCVASRYRERKWPDGYWPTSTAPPDNEAWKASAAGYHRDLEAMLRLAADPAIDLFGIVPHGTTQTYLREILLVADHTAYHLGQLVALRKQLGIWSA